MGQGCCSVNGKSTDNQMLSRSNVFTVSCREKESEKNHQIVQINLGKESEKAEPINEKIAELIADYPIWKLSDFFRPIPNFRTLKILWQDIKANNDAFEFSYDNYYKCECVYFGQVEEKWFGKYVLRHGFGALMTEFGDFYIGQWEDGKAHGLGFFINSNGLSYKGQYDKDMWNGKGKLAIPDETEYEGDFINGYKEGYGEQTWANEDIYKGYWKEGKMHTDKETLFKIGQKSEFHDATGNRLYTGEFQDGKKHGEGLMKIYKASGDEK